MLIFTDYNIQVNLSKLPLHFPY